MGRIHALQLDYTDAYTKLMQSSRKVPQNTAMGFQRAAQKLVIIVQVCCRRGSLGGMLLPYFGGEDMGEGGGLPLLRILPLIFCDGGYWTVRGGCRRCV